MPICVLFNAGELVLLIYELSVLWHLTRQCVAIREVNEEIQRVDCEWGVAGVAGRTAAVATLLFLHACGH